MLLNTCAKIPGVRVKAVCDIWEAYNLQRASRLLTQYGQEHNRYTSHGDMLEREKGLDAAVVATPDFCHAEQAVACLKAGLHVYCESPMAITVESARQMVRSAKETGKLLQIGHQRRSNPYYRFCYDHVIRETKLLGEIVAVNGQWNRPARPSRGAPRRAALDTDTLKRFGYESMQQFRNWQWCEGLAAGPVVELGVHQIDVFNWFLDAQPRLALASGGLEHHDPAAGKLFDTVMSILEYPSKKGSVRAFYQTINSNSNSGYFETLMGDQGTLYLSEVSARVKVFREESAPDWDRWVKLGYLKAPAEKPKEKQTQTEGVLLEVQETVAPPSYQLSVEFHDPPHQPHLENFFKAVRGAEPLNCPAEAALSPTVIALRLVEAAKAGQKVEFRPEDFQA